MIKQNNNVLFYSILVLLLTGVWIINLEILYSGDLVKVIKVSNKFYPFFFGYEYQLVGLALLINVFIANTYANFINISRALLLGTLYFIAAVFTIISDNFIGMLAGIEIMALLATILLFIPISEKSYLVAKRYFLTHLISGSLILIGVTYHPYTPLIELSPLITGNFKTSFPYLAILIGLLINIAAFPFSGWLIKCYPNSSNTSFFYLINFTTKVNLILLFKLFAGLDFLKYIGLIMVAQSTIGICLEDNLKRLFCYVNLFSIGIAVISISQNQPNICQYLFLDILYKIIFALLIIILQDKANIRLISEMEKLKQYKISIIIFISSLLSVLPLLNLYPIDALACLKYLSIYPLSKTNFYYVILVSNFFIICSIFNTKLITYQYIKGNKQHNKNIINVYSLESILLFSLVIILLLSNYLLHDLQNVDQLPLKRDYVLYYIKPLVILLGALVLSWYIKFPRIKTLPLNFDIIYLLFTIFKPILSLDIGYIKANNKPIDNDKFHSFFKFLNHPVISLFIIFIFLISLIYHYQKN